MRSDEAESYLSVVALCYYLSKLPDTVYKERKQEILDHVGGDSIKTMDKIFEIVETGKVTILKTAGLEAVIVRI